MRQTKKPIQPHIMSLCGASRFRRITSMLPYARVHKVLSLEGEIMGDVQVALAKV